MLTSRRGYNQDTVLLPVTGCAYRDGPRNAGLVRTVPTNTKVFLRRLFYVGKADLGKGS